MLNNLIAVKNSSDRHCTNEDFDDFMNLAESEFNLRAKASPGLYCGCSANDLENVAVNLLREISPRSAFDEKDIKLVSGQRFPDIIANKHFGIEVKSTKQNHWTSTGSSIIESTRVDSVENIYMLFGKLGGKTAEFKCRPYGDCLYDIAVTHSPRYLINMELTKEESIFNKMNTTYDDFRKNNNAISDVRKYYYTKAKQNGRSEMPWWFDNDNSDVANINVKLWSSCSEYEKDILTAKMFILFPEVLESKYTNIALWLCTYYSIITPNVRDIMSASGQLNSIQGGDYLGFAVPRIIGNILQKSSTIKGLFYDSQFIKNELIFYRSELFNSDSPYDTWLNDISYKVELLLERKCGSSKKIPFKNWFEDEIILSRR